MVVDVGRSLLIEARLLVLSITYKSLLRFLIIRGTILSLLSRNVGACRFQAFKNTPLSCIYYDKKRLILIHYI